jgi:hypothetical protein
MFTVKSPRRWTNSLVPSSGSTIRNSDRAFRMAFGLFFGHQQHIGKRLAQSGRDQRIGGLVGGGHRAFVGLRPHVHVRPARRSP